MSQLIYVDTNVYLDYLFNRKDRLRPLGDFAFELMRKTVSCEYTILISDAVIDELENHVTKEKIFSLITMLRKKLVTIRREEQDIRDAKNISRRNCWDALHYVLAKRGGAELIVTRNVQYFAFSELEIKLPENL